MNILEQAKGLYDKCNIDMFADISRYMAFGHVFISPHVFLLFKPVDRNLEINPVNQWQVENPNAWYVHMAIGKVKDFIGQAPYSLPHVGWMRATKDHPIRWYDFNKIIRRK